MKVAFSKISITPKDVIGKAMAGYSRPDPCLGILDEIHSYGVLIEENNQGDNKKYLLLISLDLLKVPISIADYIKKKLKSEFNYLEPNQILIHSTHTHSAPDLTGEFHWPGGTFNVIKGIMFGVNRNDQYIVWFTYQIVKMVRDLFNKLEPCKIAWTKKNFNPDIVINRRHPTRRSKPELGVITFRSLNDNKLIGFIINYACHPTTLSFKNNKLSADYPGRIIYKIDELTNNKIKAVYFNGAAADLNPITTCGVDYDSLEQDKKPIYDQLGTYEHTEKLGFIIAKEALKLAESIKNEEYFEEIEFTSYLRNFWVPMKDHKYFSDTWLTNKLSYSLKKYLIVPITKILSEEANFPAFVIKRRKFRINCHTVIQYIKIKVRSKTKSKEFSILTVPGELFEDLGKLIFKNSQTGKNNSFIFQNTNDWIAYLFPLKEYAEYGGYEPVASFSPLCGDYVTKEILKLFEAVKDK